MIFNDRSCKAFLQQFFSRYKFIEKSKTFLNARTSITFKTYVFPDEIIYIFKYARYENQNFFENHAIVFIIQWILQ